MPGRAMYRVWWIPQVPMDAFYVEVDTLSEARLLMKVLADYDMFQFENRVKPDYCNAGGVQVLDTDNTWVDAADDDGGWES